jgi:predicted anti-sigma-YlaC factor YlaD
MNQSLKKVLGPRITADEWAAHRGRYMLPTVLLVLAAVMLVVSIFLPYWLMQLNAPQYPGGLRVTGYVNRMTGDVHEIDSLNHYIGMRKLDEAAQLERSLSVMMITALSLLVLGAVFIHSKWAALLSVPAILFPAGFLIDLYLWLSYFGNNLDPTAPLSSSIKPFTPPVLGTGKVGQFETVASAGPGLILATVASVVILIALWRHRAAYKPLLEKRTRGGADTSPPQEPDVTE